MTDIAYKVIGIWRTKRVEYGYYSDIRFLDQSVGNAIKWLRQPPGIKPYQIQVWMMPTPEQVGFFGLRGKSKLVRYYSYRPDFKPRSNPLNWYIGYAKLS